MSEATTPRSWVIRGANEVVREEYPSDEKPLALTVPARPQEAAMTPRRDWSSALDLIQEATEAIRLSEERVEELEREAEEQQARTREELLVLRGQLQLAQKEIESAYARAEAAEAQAEESNEWLTRLDSAISQSFGRASAKG